jgi:beta-glucanase (GH16 family)
MSTNLPALKCIRPIRSLFALTAFATTILLASVQLVPAAPPAGAGYQLLFAEEFDNITSLSQTKFKFGFGWGTNSGAFSESNREQNLSFADGCIIFKAEDDGGYKSAAINTKQNMKMKYGYWEVRSRVDKHVSGVLPAFWQKLTSEAWPPELDIYEFFGTNGKQAMTIHWSSGSHQQAGSQVDIGSAAEFHVYGLEYTKDYIRWITDGKVIREITPSSHGTFFSQWSGGDIYTMLNIHMTDKYGWLGSVDRSKLPVRMYVDYFRMYVKGAVSVQPGSQDPAAAHHASVKAGRMVSVKGHVVSIALGTNEFATIVNGAGKVMRVLPGSQAGTVQASLPAGAYIITIRNNNTCTSRRVVIGR